MRRGRTILLYVCVTGLGVAAFLYPFWLPVAGGSDTAHRGDAALVVGVVAVVVVTAVVLDVRQGLMNGTAVALLAVLSAMTALLRLLDLPGGGNTMFFLPVLAGAAFGPRFGLLLGLSSMAVSAILTGGIGPWLPFQMLTLAWMSAGAGFLGRATCRMRPWAEVSVLAAYGWSWGFVYGAIMNLWFWPFVVGDGPLAWHPGLGAAETLAHFWRFYVVTSLAWDAAGAVANAALILMTGVPVLRSMRRFSTRISPAAELVPTHAS